MLLLPFSNIVMPVKNQLNISRELEILHLENRQRLLLLPYKQKVCVIDLQ